MRVYHFVSADYGLLNIRRRRLKVSTFNDLNDPFELLGYAVRDPAFRRAYLATKDDLAKHRGILCFSESWTDPVQWSHYAEKHKGICLGFDIPERLLNKVDYKPNRLKPDVELLRGRTPEAEKEMMRSMHTKFAHWSYEQERRVWIDLNQCEKENGLYFSPFSEDVRLRSAIVGHRSTVTRRELSDALGSLDAHVSKFKARLAFKSYEVTRQKNERLWT